MRWLDDIGDSTDMSLSTLWETVKDRQGSLVCCSPWSCKESDMTERLNDNKLFKYRAPTMDYQGLPQEGVVYHL